jgi:hypothetical protein
MSAVDRSRFFPRPAWLGQMVSLLAAVALGLTAPGLAAAEAAAEAEVPDDNGDVTKLAAFSVNGDRLEDFGFRVSPAYDATRSARLLPRVTPVVDVLLPNTAATKAGMRPGDRIVTSDGASTASTFFSSSKWRGIQEKKWAEVAAGKQNVTWTLEVESGDTGARRTLKLVIPTPAPHWGSSVWQAPEDRQPAKIAEPGPLAERAKLVLDNGIWILLRESYVRGFDLRADPGQIYLLYYQWTQWEGAKGHRIYVSQRRGRTDIILEAISREFSRSQSSAAAPSGSPTRSLASATTVFASASQAYLTSPSGALEKAWLLPNQREIPVEDARDGFRAEIDFWLTRVGKVSPRWPLGLLVEKTSAEGSAAAMTPTLFPSAATGTLAAGSGTQAAAFLKLPAASAEQRAMFEEALGKIGADEDRWAYTEASHGADDKRVAVTRVDPSKPAAQRCTLLKIDGKPPTPDELKRWHDEGRATNAPLGELPPIDSLVDLSDVRVQAVETAAVVFELPLRGGNKDFPADRFQALFRVNRTQRAFEDITVRLRESIGLAGVVKLTEAGLAVRFRTLDPASPPQPVLLRGGGAVRVLLVKFAREFEAVRTDFRRVEPWQEPAETGAK